MGKMYQDGEKFLKKILEGGDRWVLSDPIHSHPAGHPTRREQIPLPESDYSWFS